MVGLTSGDEISLCFIFTALWDDMYYGSPEMMILIKASINRILV